MKKKFKKILCLTAALALVFSLTACSGGAKIDSQLSMAPEIQAYLDEVDEQFAYDIAYTLAYDESLLSNELGFRTAGSDAEHAAADYLAEKMNEIGLADVEKVPVDVDKWQFNDASLTIEGTDIDIMPASYATNGTDADGITAEIVDVGMGTVDDYAGLDVKGKIVLAGVDQWNEAWIDQPMNEAALHGAVAIVTYGLESGYGAYSDDMINMQDVCSEDTMPCVSISRNQYKELKSAMEAGNNKATLIVDNEVAVGEGTTYNVVGRIAGKSSEQQIVVSGHYDVYFNGFQDDSCAIGLVLAMAKAMTDAGYQPENDIVFVCHGAEEWGASGSQYDWTTGAWRMITEAHPEWAGKTIAMLNFELPAIDVDAAQGQFQCEPEFASLVKEIVENSGILAAPVNDVYAEGYDAVSIDSFTMEDGVSYSWAGVPHFVNVPGFDATAEQNWNRDRYHTVADDADTYSADVMATNLNTYGALAIYLDKTPALQLDFTARCDDLEEAFAPELAAAAGADVDAYAKGLEDLRAASEAHNAKIADINVRYEAAVADGASEEEIANIRAEGVELNKLTLEMYKYVQDNFSGLILTEEIVIKHVPYLANIDVLEGVVAALEAGDVGNEEGTGALDIAWQINGGAEYGKYSFSKETNDASYNGLYGEGMTFWGTDRAPVFAETADAIPSIFEKLPAVEAGEKVDFDYEIGIYKDAIDAQMEELAKTMDAEAAAMADMAKKLK